MDLLFHIQNPSKITNETNLAEEYLVQLETSLPITS